MPTHPDRRRQWLRRVALGLRVAVGTLALGASVTVGVLAAKAFGNDSPVVWSISLVVGLAGGLLVMARPEVHGLAARLKRAADAGDSASADDAGRRVEPR